MADQDPEVPDEETVEDDENEFSSGDLVVSLECAEGRISVAVPDTTDPALVGRLLDLAVSAIGRLRSPMQ